MATFIKGDPAAPEPDDGTTVVYDSAKSAYVPGPTPGGGGGGGVVTVHGELTGRSAPDQHPIGAVTGLQSALDDKAAADHTHTPASVGAATAAQGDLADSAVQPGDDAGTLGSGTAADGQVLTADGAGGAAWETVSGGGGGGAVALPFSPAAQLIDQAITTDNAGDGNWSALAPAGAATVSSAGVSDTTRVAVNALSLPACTLTSLAVQVVTAATDATVRFGLWAAAAKGAPGALVFDSGTVDAAMTGWKIVAPGTAVALPAGVYWVGMAQSNTAVRYLGWQPAFMPFFGLPGVNFTRMRTPGGSWGGGALPASLTIGRTNADTVAAPAIYAKVTL